MALISTKTGKKLDLGMWYTPGTADSYQRTLQERQEQAKKPATSPSQAEREARTREAVERKGASASNTVAPVPELPTATTSRGRVTLEPQRGYSSGQDKYAWGRSASSRPAAPEPAVDYRKMVELNRMEREMSRALEQGRVDPSTRDYSKLPSSQLEILRNQAQADLDTDALNQINQVLKSRRAARGQQTFGDRADDTLSGSLSSYGAGVVNAVGTVVNAFEDPERYRREIARMQRQLEDGGYSDGVRFHRLTEGQRKNMLELIRQYADKAWQLERSTSFVNRTYALADRMQEDSGKFIASAKEGTGALGQLAVDVGVAGTQMGMDALTAALTGGSSLIPMAVRSFGGGAQEARLSGADLSQQLLYGAGSAALGVGTEKISNIAKPFQKMFGKGAAETIAGALVKRFGESGAVQLMQRLSQTAAGRIALSAIGEGGEEVIEDILQPFLKRATYDPSAKFDAGEAKQDFLVGTILGGFGGVPEAVAQVTSKPGGNRTETGPAAEMRARADADTDPGTAGLQGSRGDFTGVPGEKALVPETSMQQKTAPGTGTAAVNENGLTALTDHEKLNLASGKKNKVISTFQEAVGFVRSALANKQSVDRAYLGKIPDSVSSKILNDTGIDIRGFGMILNGNDIRHIMQHHGDATKETARGLIAVTPEDIAKIPEVLSSPDRVYLSPDSDGKGRKVLVFEKKIGNKLVTMQGVSDGKKSLQTDTLYIQKGRARMSRDTMHGTKSTAPVINAQSVPPQSSSVDPTIAQGVDSVKSSVDVMEQEVQRLYGKDAGGEDGLGAADAGKSQAFVDPDAPANDGLGNANKGFDSLSAAERMYGILPEGENPVRPDDVPAQTTAENRVSLFARTVKGAGVIPDSFIPEFEKAILSGKFSYTPVSNQETAAAVQAELAYKGWEQARSDFSRAVALGKSDEKIAYMGELLSNAAANAGDATSACEILFETSIALRNGGRAVQAARALKSMTPAGQLYMMQKSVQSMVDAMNLPEGSVKLSESLLKDYLNAADDAARNAAVDAIQQDVANQLPSTLLDKWTALRYVNMLGNFRTQGRNLLGNTAMQVVGAIKDRIAVGLEAAYKGINPDYERTRTFFADKDLMAAAKADYANVEAVTLGEGKYKEGMSNDAFARGVEEKRTIFKNNGTWGMREDSSAASRLARKTTDALWKVPEAYRNVTNWAMTQGDAVFTKHSYARALAGYLQSHNVTAEQFSSPEWQAKNVKFLDKARMHAIKEAQEITFRDSNVISDWVSRIGRRKDTPDVVRMLSEGAAPFRKTPANVLVRAEEYSPLGIANTIYTAVQAKKGNATGTDVINSLAKTTTGTALFAIGMALYKGLIPGVKIRGGDDDDEKQRAFDDLTGHQEYSIELANGFSGTLDWLAPAAMPFFMGVELAKLMEDGNLDVKDLEGSLTSIAEPMLQMSMLQGVNDTLDNLKYSSDNLGQLAATMALNYLTQGFTNSMIGQIERIFEDERQSTYIDSESPLPKWLQKEIGRASAKTPGLDYHQQPYINAWGETESNGTILERILNNSLNPGFVSHVETGELEGELQRLSDATGSSSVFPGRVDKSFKLEDGSTKYLTAEEYTQFSKKVGQTRRQLLDAIISSEVYQNFSDKDKAQTVGAVYEYAVQTAKRALVGDRYSPESWVLETMQSPVPPADVILYRKMLSIEKDKKNGAANETVRKEIFADQSLSADEKNALDDIILTDGMYIPKAKNVDYSDRDSFLVTQMSDSAVKHWDLVREEMGKVSGEMYGEAWDIFTRRGTKEKPYTKDQKIRDLMGLGLSWSEAARLYQIMGAEIK